MLFFGFVILIVVVILGVFTVVKKSQPFVEAVQRAHDDPRVVEALGDPVKPSWLVTGSVKTDNNAGSADLNVGLEGSKQKGNLAIVATKTDGRWTYTKMLVTPDKGDPIDLLQPANAPPPEQE